MPFLHKYIMQKNLEQFSNHQIHKPNYKIFTHNANLIDDKFFLGITYKNILQLTMEDYLELNNLMIKLGIKKKFKLKKSFLNKKEEKDAKNVLLHFNYELISEEEIETKIIQLLKDEGYKPTEEMYLCAKDKYILKQLLIDMKDKISYNLQKPLDENIEIKELDMTLEDIILDVYGDPKAHQKLTNLLKGIDEKFQKEHKHNSFSLLKKEENGFIKMINEDCNLSNEQLCKLKDLQEYFRDKAINKENITKYKNLHNLE